MWHFMWVEMVEDISWDASITVHQYLCIFISRPTLYETDKNIFAFIMDIVYIRIWDKNGVIRVNNVQKLKENMEIR